MPGVVAWRLTDQDAADIILCTPNGNFAVVECTTGLLKAENKLPNLHDRSQAVRRNLDASNAEHLRVLPVLVTSKTLEEIRPDIEQAEKLGIHVLTRENIERLAERTIIPHNADQCKFARNSGSDSILMN